MEPKAQTKSVRIGAGLHARVRVAAASEGISIQALVETALESVLGPLPACGSDRGWTGGGGSVAAPPVHHNPD